MNNLIRHSTSPVQQQWARQAGFRRLLARAERGRRGAELRSLQADCARAPLAAIAKTARDFGRGAQRIVWIGMGGATLPAQACAGFAGDTFFARGAVRPHIIFADTLDEAGLKSALRGNLQRTKFVVASKSGETAETLFQLRYVLAALARRSLAPRRHVLAISDAGAKRSLRRIARQHNITTLTHPRSGGRFAVASPIGLLAAAWAGLDTQALARGVREGLRAPEAATGAATLVYAAQKNYPLHLLAISSPRLAALAQWHAQIWAESCGKSGKGSTPLVFTIPRDLHSLWQLLLDGPKDKFTTLLAPESSTLPYDALTAAQAGGMQEELARARLPHRRLAMEMSAAGLGQAMGYWMQETILAAGLWGVAAFGQPAVDAAKDRAAQNKKNDTRE